MPGQVFCPAKSEDFFPQYQVVWIPKTKHLLSGLGEILSIVDNSLLTIKQSISSVKTGLYRDLHCSLPFAHFYLYPQRDLRGHCLYLKRIKDYNRVKNQGTRKSA